MEEMRNQRRLYNDLSHLWHLVSPLEDYLEETENIVEIIRQKSRRDCKTLLHLGCGRGHNDYVFKRHFGVTGVDISPTMLKWAAKLNPEVTYLPGDMRDIELNQAFDNVVSVDSVDYMTTYEDLKSLFSNAYQHLKPGGVFLFLLDNTKENFSQNETILYTNSSEDEILTVVENKYDTDVTDTEYEMTFVYLYRREGKLEVLTDRHICGLFTESRVSRLLSSAGFEVEVINYEPPQSAFGSWEKSEHITYPLFLGLKISE
jgi:SAM-dependent methyltransferase